MNISEGCVVTIQYTLTNDAGEILDTSDGRGPLTYLHGYGGMIPGLEQQLETRAMGESLQADVLPEDAYGLPDPDLIHEVPRDALEGIDNLEVGMQLQSEDEEGRTIALQVDTITDSHVTLNANHPLAGETLHFAVTIDHVREATAEELEQGKIG